MKADKMPFIKILVFAASIVLLLQGCAVGKPGNKTNNASQTTQINQEASEQPDSVSQPQDDGQNIENTSESSGDQSRENAVDNTEEQKTYPAIDLNEVKPNETGRIMVVMFHNFVEEYIKGDKAYTTTLDAFEELLETLYVSDYRLISLNDYMNGNIDTPAGCIPMVFTFDDGTAGQFNLVDEGGVLVANPRSAVGVIEKFNKTHPDFGTKGTFFVNLGNGTFKGEGTLGQRLEYLISKGFELGNHTYTHINLKETNSADKIQQEIGGNQKRMYELVPGYTFTTFSLPFGAPSKDLTQYVLKGEYEGVKYENLGVLEVGWDPAPSPFSVKFNPLAIHRVRSSGMVPVNSDLAWWLKSLKRENQYISDGNPNTVAVPEAYREYVEQERLNGRELVAY